MTDPSLRPRPLSVPEITKDASSFDYDDAIPLKYWLRTADAINKQVRYHPALACVSTWH